MSAMLSRRVFLAGSVALTGAALTGAANAPQSEAIYEFAAADWQAHLRVIFYDRYSSQGFWFRDLLAGNRFCLSAAGEYARDCSPGFTGSVAVARYQFRRLSGDAGPSSLIPSSLREHVRTIDQDSRINVRPQYDRMIELREGLASDIQAFGYEAAPPSTSANARLPESGGPWYYFRQDLYFAGRVDPFLTVHWRHAFGAIRILDVIPGRGTSAVKKGAA